MRTILIYPQWQGSADLTVYHGAMELQKRYLMGQEAAIVPVSTDETDVTEKENGIIAWKRLKQQTERAYHMLLQANPDTVLSIGGGCGDDRVPEQKIQGPAWRNLAGCPWGPEHAR